MVVDSAPIDSGQPAVDLYFEFCVMESGEQWPPVGVSGVSPRQQRYCIV
jgi:hypothetical protein